MMRIFHGLILLFVGILSISSFSSASQGWHTITAGWKSTRIVVTEEGVWAASEGGLLFVDPAREQLDIWNKDQGLFSSEINVIRAEPGGEALWIGYTNGGLDRINLANGHLIQRIRDFHDDPAIFTIYDIAFGDGAAFIATDAGVSRLELMPDSVTWIVRETYHRFDTWTTEALRVLTSGGGLFVGTHRGLARGNLDDNLIEAGNWELFPFGEAFPDTLTDSENAINLLVEIGGVLYTAVKSVGVYRYDGSAFTRVGDRCTPFGLTEDGEGRLVLGRTDGLFILNESGDAWVHLDSEDPLRQRVYDLAWGFDALWCALNTDFNKSENPGGIGRYDGGGWEFFSSNTPGGNKISHLELSPDGVIWAGAALESEELILLRGVYELRNGVWRGFSHLNTIPVAFSTSLYGLGFDVFGGTWVGTRGSGLLYIHPDESFQYFDSMDSTGARLIPYSPNDNFVLAGEMAAEPDGGLWLTNPENYLDKPLIYIPPDWRQNPGVEWIRYGPAQGIDNRFISLVERDDRGRLWMAARSPSGAFRPLTLLDPKGTPEDYSDDEIRYFSSADSLGFGNLFAMELASDGILWFGGPDSLYYVDTQAPGDRYIFHPMSLPIGTRALALESDPMGNLWVGTDFGLFTLGPDRLEWIHLYTPQDGQYPSPLVSGKVNALSLDPKTGEMYIGTDEGISVLSTPYRDLRGGRQALTIKPQPFFISEQGTQRLKFYGQIMQNDDLLSRIKEVRIFTASGRLVRILDRFEASFGWDGRRDDRKLAASGVYLIVVTDDLGNTEIGKAALVRK